MVKSLNEFRTILNNEDCPIEDVSELLLKVIDAPTRRDRRWAARERRDRRIQHCYQIRVPQRISHPFDPTRKTELPKTAPSIFKKNLL